MKFRYAVLLISALSMPSCTPIGLATGAGATVGVAAAQEGGVGRAVTDMKIQAQINDLWFRSNVNSFLKLDLTVNQGRVLVTGVVQDPEERVEAIRLAWQPEGVKQVINEVQVANSGGIAGYASDTWITTRLRTALTLDRDVQSINYSIDTVAGVVYLIGVAQSQSELNRVIETARTIPNVKRVVSYVKLAGHNISGAETGGNDMGDSSTVNSVQSAPVAPVETYAPTSLTPADMGQSGGYESDMSQSYEDYSASAGGGSSSSIEAVPLD